MTQLRSLRPPLPESDINREETSLDRAIAAVEANSSRRSLQDAAHAPASPPDAKRRPSPAAPPTEPPLPRRSARGAGALPFAGGPVPPPAAAVPPASAPRAAPRGPPRRLRPPCVIPRAARAPDARLSGRSRRRRSPRPSRRRFPRDPPSRPGPMATGRSRRHPGRAAGHGAPPVVAEPANEAAAPDPWRCRAERPDAGVPDLDAPPIVADRGAEAETEAEFAVAPESPFDGERIGGRAAGSG